MKKIISLIAAVSMLFALSTSAFAYKTSDAVVTGGTLSGKTIEYDPANTDGFVYSIVASDDLKLANYTIITSGLTDKGWTIESVDGAYTDGSVDNTYSDGKILVKFPNGTHSTKGTSVVKFKAVPGPDATIDGASFQVVATVRPNTGSTYLISANAPETFTIVEAAVQEDKTTATIAANGEVTFDYADADVADAKLDGKKVVLSTTAVAGNEITADTTVAVTYTDGDAVETKTFGETLFEKLGAEGFGFLEADSITFGIVCDATMTGTFSFALN